MNLPSADPAAIPTAANYLVDTLTGGLAAAVAIIAVAWFGLMVMSGKLSRRRGVQLILGCFIIFGAPLIAGGIMKSLGGAETPDSSIQPLVAPALQVPAAIQRPVSNNPYDPYAGAALPPRR